MGRYIKYAILLCCLAALMGCQRLTDSERNTYLGDVSLEISAAMSEAIAEESEAGLEETESSMEESSDRKNTILCVNPVEYDIDSFFTFVWKGEEYRREESIYGELYRGSDDWILLSDAGVRYEKLEAKSTIYRGVSATYLPFLGQQEAYLKKRYPAIVDENKKEEILAECNAYINALGVAYSEIEMYRLDMLEDDGFRMPRTDLENGDEEWWIMYRRPVIDGRYQESLQGEGITTVYYSVKRGVLMISASPSVYQIISKEEVDIISEDEVIDKVTSLAVRYMIDPECILIKRIELVYVEDINRADEAYTYLRPCWRIEYVPFEGKDPFYIDKEIGWTYDTISDESGYLLLDAQSGDITYYFIGG